MTIPHCQHLIKEGGDACHIIRNHLGLICVRHPVPLGVHRTPVVILPASVGKRLTGLLHTEHTAVSKPRQTPGCAAPDVIVDFGVSRETDHQKFKASLAGEFNYCLHLVALNDAGLEGLLFREGGSLPAVLCEVAEVLVCLLLLALYLVNGLGISGNVFLDANHVKIRIELHCEVQGRVECLRQGRRHSCDHRTNTLTRDRTKAMVYDSPLDQSSILQFFSHLFWSRVSNGVFILLIYMRGVECLDCRARQAML